MCSVLNSLLKALTVLFRELKSLDTKPRTWPQRSSSSTKQHWAYRQGKTKQQKKQIYEGQLLVRQEGIFFTAGDKLWKSFKTSALSNARSYNYFSILISVLQERKRLSEYFISLTATHPNLKYHSDSKNIIGNGC